MKALVGKRKLKNETGLIYNDVVGWFEPMAVPNGDNDPVRRRVAIGHRGVEENDN